MLSVLLEEILNESVSMDDINDAIDNHKRVIINYHTKGENFATGARVIEVYAYGLTKAGNPVIRAFEPYGDTTTRVPRWKFFRLDRISTWKPTEQTFSRPASFYYKGLGEFNAEGDESMSTVYKITSFDNDANMIVNKNKGVDKDKGSFKTDTELGMERLKQQLTNPITLKDLEKQKSGSNISQQNLNTSNEDDIFKTDTEKNMERLKQQLENPRYIDDYRDNNELEKLRQKLGDTTEPMSMDDFNKRLSNEDDILKTDTEKNMERLKQQLENPRYIDLDKIRR
jgi:hypothetical protein